MPKNNFIKTFLWDLSNQFFMHEITCAPCLQMLLSSWRTKWLKAGKISSDRDGGRRPSSQNKESKLCLPILLVLHKTSRLHQTTYPSSTKIPLKYELVILWWDVVLKKRWHYKLNCSYGNCQICTVLSRFFKVKQTKSKQLQLHHCILTVLEINPALAEITNARTVAVFYSPFSRLQYVASFALGGVKLNRVIWTPLPLWANQLLWSWIQLQTHSLFWGFERLPFVLDWNQPSFVTGST